MSGSELMKAPPLNFGTGTIDGDEEGGALELGTLNLELGTWNIELGTLRSAMPLSRRRWPTERTWNLELGTWNLET